MSRLDQEDGNKPKRVVTMGPSSDQIQERGKLMADSPPIDQGQIRTAASYGTRSRQATARIKRPSKPLGGAPPIPPEKTRAIAQGLQPSFEDPAAEKPKSRAPSGPPQQMGGVGSGYHVNQEMARGNIKNPVSMKEAKQMTAEEQAKGPSRTPMSQESVAAMEQIKKGIDSGEDGEPIYDDTQERLDEADDEVLPKEEEEEEDPTDLFDTDAIAEQRGKLATKERRKAIEEMLEPLNIGDLVTKREIRQVIVIVPEQLSYTLRTYSQQEYLYCLGFIYDNPGSAMQAEERLNLCKLVCGLVAINGAELPDHRTDIGTTKEKVGEEAFKRKMFHVASFPVNILGDISIQAAWFNDRVNELMNVGVLKNG